LADEGHGTLEAYGVWGEKSLAGKKYLGISRTSFLIDPAGRLAKIYKDVKPAEHAAQVLQDLTALQG
ncbi:MAG TPA: peroxiredoxin, partial [Patescibacteria group bacterium]|nr:peroxiredoxin [Patescibacteria group bacterium]